jgi:hypothetical protein
LKKWFEQTEKETRISGGIPVVCWKKSRGDEWVIFCFGDFAKKIDTVIPKDKVRLCFANTIVFAFEDFLQYVEKSLIFNE